MTRRMISPLVIAADHDLTEIIGNMLERRGDNPGVARGRAIAITEMLIKGNWIDRKKALRNRRERIKTNAIEYMTGKPRRSI